MAYVSDLQMTTRPAVILAGVNGLNLDSVMFQPEPVSDTVADNVCLKTNLDFMDAKEITKDKNTVSFHSGTLGLTGLSVPAVAKDSSTDTELVTTATPV